MVGTHLSLYVFKRYAAAGTKARTSVSDTLQKPRVVRQAVLQPVILRLKADQNARRLAVASARGALADAGHGRSKRWLDDLAIDIFSVSNLEDRDLAMEVVDEIDNTVPALTYSIPVVIPGEFFGLL
jgi:hypothetical protein